MTNDRRISDRARQEIADADAILVSAISFFEIAQKVRIEKWPEMAPHLHQLLESQRAIAASLEAADCLLAGAIVWRHRDPFDRLLIATALRHRIAIVSADPVFDGSVARIW